MAELPAPTAAASLDDLLEKTSRTFALSIPLLPEPTRQEVTIAYLLFRIADTFEDAAAWPKERRIEALGRFVRLVERPAAEEAGELAAAWSAALPDGHDGYRELLAETPAVLAAFDALGPHARSVVGRHTVRTARGMAGFVARADGGGRLELVDLADLAGYCYVVAGIVGEMLTELFLLDRPALAPAAPELRRHAARFGEALQLVNILKDAADDAGEGRRFLPAATPRAAVFARARSDLDAAARYVAALQERTPRQERGLVAFCALPVRLALATLDRVEDRGAGAKLTRPEVFAIAAELESDLEAGRPAVRSSGTPVAAQIG
jgi:farnesyl-diphosphate farnesyltransferase